ncbi:MAG TPA: DUF892 family protein [Bryobacteraceae bacterium]|jgi:ferritin-like metal-binding protein YciE|nr:DUF892 family protein [Bryobacteraceae bacterium]
MAARPNQTFSTSGPGAQVLRKYLADAYTSETKCESELRRFAATGNDEDVQSTFASHADETKAHAVQLREHYAKLYTDTELNSGPVSLFDLAFPPLANAANSGPAVPEEITLQNLLMAYTVETGEIAMYETLAALATAAGDAETELLARKLQSDERRAADKIWHFISTRAKLAFNMLTVSEVDPAVDTKMADDRIVQ